MDHSGDIISMISLKLVSSYCMSEVSRMTEETAFLKPDYFKLILLEMA